MAGRSSVAEPAGQCGAPRGKFVSLFTPTPSSTPLIKTAVSSLEPLEARIAPAYVLHTVVTAVHLPDVVVPGDSGSVTFTVTNAGDSDFVPGGFNPGGIHVDFSSTGAAGGTVMSGPEFED